MYDIFLKKNYHICAYPILYIIYTFEEKQLICCKNIIVLSYNFNKFEQLL